MRSALRQTAVEVAAEAIVRGGWDNEIAAFIKKQMERRHQSISGGKWHCIVGPDFGSYVTHEKGFFTYLCASRAPPSLSLSPPSPSLPSPSPSPTHVPTRLAKSVAHC